jgi:hypothetical protein
MDVKLNKTQESMAYIMNFIDKAIVKGGIPRKDIVTVNECINTVGAEIGLDKALNPKKDEEIQLEE